MPKKRWDFDNKSEWMEELESTNTARKQTPWEMAYLVLWGIETYCQTKDDVMVLYDEVSEQLEVARKTLMNYASVARRFPPESIHERLEIGHHIAVVTLDEQTAHTWLDQAESGAWSVMRLRTEIFKAAQAPNDDEGDDDTIARRTLALKTLNGYGINAYADEISLTMGFPDGKFVVVRSPSQLQWRVT